MSKRRYRAFISYSHRDSKWGKWLQSALESYKLPKDMIGRTTDLGGGYGLDMSIGPYVYPVKPTGGPEWSLKFGLTLLLPR